MNSGSNSALTPQAPSTKNLFSSMKPIDAPKTASKPPPSGMFPSLPEPLRSPQKDNASAKSSIGRLAQKPMDKTKVDIRTLSHITDEAVERELPTDIDDAAKLRFCAAIRLRVLNQAMEKMFKVMPLEYDPTEGLEFYKERRQGIISTVQTDLAKLSTRGFTSRALATEFSSSNESPAKRKSAETNDQENKSPSKRSKQADLSAPVTGGLFSNGDIRLNGQAESVPPRSSLSENGLQSSVSSSAPSQNGGFPSVLGTPSPTKGKRKAEDHLDQNTVEMSPLRKIKTPKQSSAESANSGSNTSNIFKNILDTPQKHTPIADSPDKKTPQLTKKSAEGAPRTNPFGSLFVPESSSQSSSASSNVFSPKPSSNSPNLFQIKPAPIATPSSMSSPKPTATSNPFQLKPTSSNTTTQLDQTIKPPVFSTGPTDFMAQFGQQAAKNADEEKEKACKHIFDEDYDSDEGMSKEDFMAKVRKEYDERLAENEKLSKTGSGFQLKPSENTAKSSSAFKTTDSTKTTASKPLFGVNAPSQGSNSSVFSSLNGSRTSTPGPFGSSTGSVLDGHIPGKPVTFGSNIFGHLSDADSVKGGDGDDSADEESDADAENKDPNYAPGSENGSGPGTPAEETGAGIASEKKGSLFNFGTPRSGSLLDASSPTGGIFGRIGNGSSGEKLGASAPSGGLFDRIPKDSNSNPAKNASTEEKENTQPSAASVFSSPFKSLGAAPVDQTWKPDSPIRFGTSTNAPPAVSVTAATPTKIGSPSGIFGGLASSSPKPFSNLFGNSSDPKSVTIGNPPTSSLFGNLNSAKGSASTNVGFGFGAASGASSLLPSVAGSATTSRATSPGATTDGDSGADADPDAEHHEQINLTAGGPGEEDEEVVHEVRAKALKWIEKKDDENAKWDTRGVGPLRVLKHKDTGIARILLRGDPSGKIILNKGLLPKISYEASAKTVKFVAAADVGEGLETWIVQVKTPEFAEKLAEVLESNKSLA
jgi:hypothetical protein